MSQEVQIKEPRKFDEQVQRLKNKHKLAIEDYKKAEDILKRVNYYRLLGYGVGLREDPHDNNAPFKDGVSLYQLYQLYNFDTEFKNNLMLALENIEIELRTQIAYHHAHTYGGDGYLDGANFSPNSYSYHQGFLNLLDDEIYRQRNARFIAHHIENYDSILPIWVAVEIMSFGTLINLYNMMKDEDKKKVYSNYTKNEDLFNSWLHSLLELRNVCAHYSKLYYRKLLNNPKLKGKEAMHQDAPILFKDILVIKSMLIGSDAWVSFLDNLLAIMDKYKDYYELDKLGFPDNWQMILKS